jgi:dienelactone hydrolase
MIVVDQPDALVDQPIAMALRGFAPRQPVSVIATQTYAEAARWQSRATFISDNVGQVDVTRQAPASGTYEGVAPMGLFWSMHRLPNEGRPPPPGAIMLPVPVQIEAEGADGRRAEITIVRRVAGPGVTRHVIRTDGIVGTLFLPPGAGPHPAVMVLSGGGGGIDEFRGAILASHGYAALALGHFAVEGRPRGLVNIPLEYFEMAIHWIRAQPWLDHRLLAAWGTSRGGELALLLGASFPQINAVAAWVPSGVVFWALGLAEPGDTRPAVAWTFHGKPLPYLQENNTSGDPPPLLQPGRPVAYTPFYRSQLRDARAVERASIPVEKIRGPVQLISGGDDQMWPSSDLADIALRRLETHRHPFPFRHLKYPEAGHTILVPYWPLPELRVLTLARVEGAQDHLLFQGGTAKADAEAGIDAWRDLLSFLNDAKTLSADQLRWSARADEVTE